MITEKEYIEATIRLKELLKVMDSEGKNEDESLNKEFYFIRDIIEKYEEEHFPRGI